MHILIVIAIDIKINMVNVDIVNIKINMVKVYPDVFSINIKVHMVNVYPDVFSSHFSSTTVLHSGTSSVTLRKHFCASEQYSVNMMLAGVHTACK